MNNHINCAYCFPTNLAIIWQCKQASLAVPAKLHIAPRDGGHLIAFPHRHVTDRRRLDPLEATAVDLCSLIAAELLRLVFGADWQNYQENGNWGVADSPISQHHMHLHIYGRSRSAVEQPFGEALRFPSRSELNRWKPGTLTGEQYDRLIACVDTTVQEYPEYLAALGIS